MLPCGAGNFRKRKGSTHFEIRLNTALDGYDILIDGCAKSAQTEEVCAYRKILAILCIYQQKFAKDKLKPEKFEILFAKTGSEWVFKTLKKGGIGQQKTPLKPL
jgi:hypothetical protein